MPSTTSSRTPGTRRAPAPDDVEAFLAALDHPLKPEILALRQIILNADPGIAEAIKWNAPSFYTREHFATFHLRAKDGVQIVLHFGAKKRDDTPPPAAIADPESLLKWPARDRATATFQNLADIEAKRPVFTDLIRQWIRYV